MPSNTRISKLAELIQGNIEKVDNYLNAEGIKSPSFDIDTPANLKLSPEIEQAKEAILDATDELQRLLLGPQQCLTQSSVPSMVCLQAIERFNIATSFPVGEEASFAEIAKKCGITEDDTKRVLRQAMSQHIFREPRKGYAAHTSISREIAENPLMRDWIAFNCSEQWRAAPRVVDAMEKWPGSQEPEHSGWSLANNATARIDVETLKYPERLHRLPGAMQMIGSRHGLHPKDCIDSIDWNGVKTFVDVGGAGGSVSFEVARKAPSVKCIVQDVPFIVAMAHPPPDVASHIEYMPHDFFTPQPVKGADIYFLRWILHDWTDKYALQILQNLIPALKKGARIIINEFVLPEPGLLSPYQEQAARNLDFAVKLMVNAKERDAEEFASLIQTASPNFKLTSIKLPPRAKLAVIEVVWDGESFTET
jgi:hypothetical protein